MAASYPTHAAQATRPAANLTMPPHGVTIRGVLASRIGVPVRSVVSASGGSPLMHEANDGVVTVASQTRLEGPEYHTVDYNHFEVLLADPVIDLAQEFLFEAAA